MQRIINDPDQVVEDYLKGFVKAHKEIVSPTGHPRVLKRVSSPQRGKVGIVTGGGSGHKPAFVGYIGRNLVDSVAVGEVFSSPTAKAFHEAIQAADGAALGFAEALDAMVEGAYAGWQSTKDMVARVGRASRLGERSRGTLDAGATSCYLIMKSLAQSMKELSI